MHDRVDWIKPSDEVILQEIRKYGGWIEPSTIYLNVGYSQRHVQKRCKSLWEHSVLDRHDDTVAYRLNDFGRRWLRRDINPSELRAADT